MYGNSYLAMKRKASTLPTVFVTKEEMIQKFLAAGYTKERTEEQIYFCEQMGSSVMIGNEMVGLAKPTS